MGTIVDSDFDLKSIRIPDDLVNQFTELLPECYAEIGVHIRDGVLLIRKTDKLQRVSGYGRECQVGVISVVNRLDRRKTLNPFW